MIISCRVSNQIEIIIIKAHFVESKPFQRQLFKEFAAQVYENHKINIDADVVDDILETTCGHPGFSIWMLINSIQQAIGHGFLTTAEWIRGSENIMAILWKGIYYAP